MTTTIEAVYEKGIFRPKRRVALKDGQEVRLTIVTGPNDDFLDAEFTALASEDALGRIWNDPKEDEAWAHL